MGYISTRADEFTVPLARAQVRTVLGRFCRDAFPSARPYGTDRRLAVSLSLTDGASAYVTFDLADVSVADPTAMPATRVVISAHLSGAEVTTDARGRAEAMRFVDQVARSLQRTLDQYAAEGMFRTAARIRLPRFTPRDVS